MGIRIVSECQKVYLLTLPIYNTILIIAGRRTSMKQKAKHLSILLAFSLILGSIPGTNASAAKKVSIIKKVSVTAGKTKKIKLKNNKNFGNKV